MPPIYSKEWNRITIQVRGDHRQGRTSPCEHACPLGNGIQQMHTLIAAGETGKALARLHARNPFPGITGRVCPHPCETKCNRAEYDEPVAIHALERFAADTGHETRFIPLPASGKRVAVVGSGPAGLTAARFAALLGHAVTVYESAPVMGGVPRHAVPDFRLPKDVVDRETGAIVASGVQVRTNVTVGRDITLQSLLDTYDATILAVGLWKERRLDIPGKEHLVPAVGWLKRSTLERQSLTGKTVVILGGGGWPLTAPSPPAASTPMPYISSASNLPTPCAHPPRRCNKPSTKASSSTTATSATPSPRKADASASRPGP